MVSSNSVDLSGQMTYDIRLFFGTGDSPYSDEDINFNDTRYAFYAYRDTTAKGVCDDTQVALDWFFELEKGHRIYASAFAAAGNIYFGTSTGDTEDPCDINANSDPDFDANAGKLYAFDLDGIKKFESRWAMCGPHRWSKTNTFTFRRSTATSTRSATVNIIMQPARAVFPKS